MNFIRKKSTEWEQTNENFAPENTTVNAFENNVASEVNKESKKIKSNSSLEEQEFYNSLSTDDKENYRIQKLNKKKLWVNIICLLLLCVVWFGWKFYLESQLNSVVEKNEELKAEADDLQRKIANLNTTEVLLEDVAVSWLMSKAIYEQRDEVLDLLWSVEALTPNDLTFKLNKIQRNWAFNYKIDFELVPKDDPTSLNKAIVDTAYMVETLSESKTILSLANRDKYHFEITEFKGTTYSKSTKTFPLSVSVKMVKESKSAKKTAADNKTE